MINSYGGPARYQFMLDSEQQMKYYALNSLKIDFTINENGKFDLNFLTGAKFLHQTLFCIYSFFQHLSKAEKREFSVTVFDDGSLSPENISCINTHFPGIHIIAYQESIATINAVLPKDKFPFIHKKANELFFFNKILFLHTQGRKGLKIYMDADMLFFRRPVEILDWLYKHHQSNTATFALEDIKISYGYTSDIIQNIIPNCTIQKINAGLYAMHTHIIDYNYLEDKIREIDESYGSSYYMEQLITYLLLTQHDQLTLLPIEKYIVFPTEEEVRHPKGTLHHYVDLSKYSYLTTAWKLIIR